MYTDFTHPDLKNLRVPFREILGISINLLTRPQTLLYASQQ